MRSRKQFTVTLLPTLLCLVAMLLAACGSPSTGPGTGGNGPASPDKQVLRWPIGATDFGTFDPALVQLAVDAESLQTVFTGLVQFDHTAMIRDQLAQSHEISADGLTYTFHLRPNLKFSDGTPLTSQDVVYSINRALLPATKSQVAYYLNLVKDYDKITTGKIPTLIGDSLLAPDPSTVKIIISANAAYFLAALTYPNSYVVEKSLIDKYGATWTDHLDQGGGDSPFKVQNYNHTKGMILVPNSNYYGPQPKIQKLEYLISGDQDTTYNAYLSHQYDTTGVIGVPPAHLAGSRSRPDFVEYYSLRIRYVTMNYLVKPFDNIHIRQAFALAVDKDLLAKTVFRNAFVPTNHVIPQGMPGYDANLKGPAGVSSVSGDKTMAKQLFQQGMQEEHLTSFPSVTFSYYTDAKVIVDASQAIIQMWQTVLGVTVKSEGFTFDKLITLQNATVNNPKGLQIWISGWLADYPDPQDWLSTFFQKGSGYNQVKEQIVDDVGWLPIYQGKIQALQSKKLVGIANNALQIVPPDDWGNIYFTQ